MIQKAIVTATNGGSVTVIPLLKDSCVSCKTGCSKQGPSFNANNPLSLPVKQGSVVLLSASRKMQALQGLFALLLPVLSSVAGFFAAKPVMNQFGIEAGDGLKALFVLAFLVLASSIVFFVTRKVPLPGTPEITEIL